MENNERNPTWNSDEDGFHDSLKASTGLKKQKRDYPPPIIQPPYGAALPGIAAPLRSFVPAPPGDS